VINVSYAGVDSPSAEATGLAIKDHTAGLLFWARKLGPEMTSTGPTS